MRWNKRYIFYRTPGWRSKGMCLHWHISSISLTPCCHSGPSPPSPLPGGVQELPPGPISWVSTQHVLILSSGGQASQSAWAALTNHHGLGGLNNKYLFFTVLETRGRRSGVNMVGVQWEPSPWLAEGLLLTVSSHGGQHKRSGLFLLIETLIPSWGPSLMISSKLNHLPKAPPPNTITLGDKASTHGFWRWHKHQSITPGHVGSLFRNLQWLPKSPCTHTSHQLLYQWSPWGVGGHSSLGSAQEVWGHFLVLTGTGWGWYRH